MWWASSPPFGCLFKSVSLGVWSSSSGSQKTVSSGFRCHIQARQHPQGDKACLLFKLSSLGMSPSLRSLDSADFLGTELDGISQASLQLGVATWLDRTEAGTTDWIKMRKEYVKAVYIVTLLIYLICRVYHEKCQAGWSSSCNQDCREKYQQPQICR